jgi:hypothetical protein
VEVVFGHELAEKEEFVQALDQCITLIKTGDVASALETLLEQVRVGQAARREYGEMPEATPLWECTKPTTAPP